MNFETCILTNNLNSSISKNVAKIIETLLNHYAVGNQATLEGRLIKYRDIPGGYAYECALINRAIKPIEQAFGTNPKLLVEASKLLGGKTLSIGDYSIEIQALKNIPLTYILYVSDEFPVSGSILYDKSASDYLPTEDLAVLGEVTTLRLIQAKEDIT